MTYPLTITLDEGPNGLVIAKTNTAAAGAASPGEAVDTLISLVEVSEVGPLTAPEPRREIIFTLPDDKLRQEFVFALPSNDESDTTEWTTDTSNLFKGARITFLDPPSTRSYYEVTEVHADGSIDITYNDMLGGSRSTFDRYFPATKFAMHPTSPEAPKDNRSVREVLKDAYESGDLVYIRGYHVDGTEMDSRVIDVDYIDGNLVGGHDYLNDGYRNFRIDKLTEAKDDQDFCRRMLDVS